MLPARDGVREVQAQLDRYVERLGGRIPLEAVVVVGSRARGDHLRTSDVDLVVVAPHFSGLPRPLRIELLLEDWDDLPPLEPMGFVKTEIMSAQSLYLWDALADGRPVLDAGVWAEARGRFFDRVARGELTRTRRGWRIDDSWLPELATSLPMPCAPKASD